MAGGKEESVKVAVRCRPMNSKEITNGTQEVVVVDSSRNQVSVRDPSKPEGGKLNSFTFDYAYGSNSTQKQVYEQCASPIVTCVLEGYNGTIFAYGQTGTGKTHTMVGDRGNSTNKGIIPRSFEHIFKVVNGTTDKQFMVRCSMLELYNEEIRDLLVKSDEKLKLRRQKDGTVFVEQLTFHDVKDEAECLKLLDRGSNNKEVASTEMNKESSRSHTIFTLIVETSQPGEDGEPHIKKGKLNLVDLAGSERQKKTQATGKQFKEACSINLSLVTLGNVIQALVEKNSSHVPYRDSKLTILLEDSLGGNAKTIMIAAIGPSDYNFDETCNTLRYADRAKRIKNAPKINENPKDAKIREMQEQIELLKKQLGEKLKNNGVDVSHLMTNYAQGGHDEELRLLEQKIREEDERLEREAEEERKQIEDMQNIDKKKREEMMKNLKAKQDQTEKEKQEKEKLLRELREREERLLMGNKRNEQEMILYTQEIELIKKEMENKARKQEEMQREIANAQLMAAELTDKLASNKDNIRSKQTNLERMKVAIEERRNILDRMKDDHEAGTEEFREDIKDKQKMIKLYYQLMNYIPKDYREFVLRDTSQMGPGAMQVPNRQFTGNRMMEEALMGKAKLISAWREGNDPEIAYHSDDRREDMFYRKFRDPGELGMEEGDVPIVGKDVVPAGAGED